MFTCSSISTQTLFDGKKFLQGKFYFLFSFSSTSIQAPWQCCSWQLPSLHVKINWWCSMIILHCVGFSWTWQPLSSEGRLSASHWVFRHRIKTRPVITLNSLVLSQHHNEKKTPLKKNTSEIKVMHKDSIKTLNFVPTLENVFLKHKANISHFIYGCWCHDRKCLC